jgi:hypothetical protein
MEAIATRWCAITREALQAMAGLDRLPPVERLRRMTERLLEDRTLAVERALRDWARADERVADAVAESDRHVFGVVQQALLELGFSGGQARMRAGTLVYAGIGYAHGQRSLPKPTKNEVSLLLDMIANTAAERLDQQPQGHL